MAEYLVLIYEDESKYASASPEVWNEVMQEHQKFAENNGKAIKGGHALQPTTSATSIRQSPGKPVVTDAPFAETKEALGGYYLIEAKDLDAAIKIAKQVPARFGGVEVRPVMVFD
jgi:hypothetical protein